MSVASINISVDSEIKDQAQEMFASLGLDMSTAVNNFLRQAVRQQRVPMADDFDAPLDCTIDPVIIQPDPTKTPQPGCMRGKIWMADDFDAPMEEFEEYM